MTREPHQPQEPRPGLGGSPQDVYETFEALPVAVLGLRGPELRVGVANAAYRSLMGREVIGLPMRKIAPEVDGQNLYEAVERAYRSGTGFTVSEWHMQFDAFDGNGLQDHWIAFDLVPHRAADGEVTGVDVLVTETTDQVLARRTAQARVTEAERQLSEAQDVITALQRELLPPGLPVLAGARVAATYLLAEGDSAAGGDWFDAVPLADGRLVLVVGDVVGHGVTASATMGQLRAVLHDRLDEDGDAARALAAADRLARRLPGARAATICAAVLDTTTGELTYCTAGHPPPLVVPAAGEARFLPPTGAGPLASGTPFTVATAHLEADDVLLLHSDGLLERPGMDLPAATVELARVAADVVAGRAFRDPAHPVDRLAAQVVELLVRPTGHADDVTVLAARREPAPAPLVLDVLADLTAVAVVRAKLDAWLQGMGTGRADADALRHAVGELVTNAAEHAYAGAPEPGRLQVHAGLDATGLAEIRVSDQGRWRPATETAGRGHGLAMAADLAHELHVEHEARTPGTRATIRHLLSRPATLLTTGDLNGARQPSDGPALMLVLDQPGSPTPRVRVDGPVDATTAPHLEVQLRNRTRGGTQALVADLTGVTHLASAGVSVLQAAAGRHHDDEQPLTLYAAAGSPAAQVLSLVALEHLTTDPCGTSSG